MSTSEVTHNMENGTTFNLPTTTGVWVLTLMSRRTEGLTSQVTSFVHDPFISSMHPSCRRVFRIRRHYLLCVCLILPIPAKLDFNIVQCKTAATHPLKSKYPVTQTSPGVPIGTTFPSASTTLAFTCGCTLPTVSTRLVTGSEGVVWKDTGLPPVGSFSR